MGIILYTTLYKGGAQAEIQVKIECNTYGVAHVTYTIINDLNGGSPQSIFELGMSMESFWNYVLNPIKDIVRKRGFALKVDEEVIYRGP